MLSRGLARSEAIIGKGQTRSDPRGGRSVLLHRAAATPGSYLLRSLPEGGVAAPSPTPRKASRPAARGEGGKVPRGRSVRGVPGPTRDKRRHGSDDPWRAAQQPPPEPFAACHPPRVVVAGGDGQESTHEHPVLRLGDPDEVPAVDFGCQVRSDSCFMPQPRVGAAALGPDRPARAGRGRSDIGRPPLRSHASPRASHGAHDQDLATPLTTPGMRGSQPRATENPVRPPRSTPSLLPASPEARQSCKGPRFRYLHRPN